MALIFMLAFITSCQSPKAPDVSGINVDLKINRFEKDLFSISGTGYHQQIDSLLKKYPVLFPFYFQEIGGWNITTDSGAAWKDSVLHYVQAPYSEALYDSVMLRFADLKQIEEPLRKAFTFYKYYFPDIRTPEVNTLINAPPAFTIGNDMVCISLDKYLGPASAFYAYETEPIPNYLLRRFKPEYITANSLQVFSTASFEFNTAGKKLLDAMIYYGKILYLKQKVMPFSPDSIVTGFTAADLKWCEANEPEIWKFFIEKKLLYSTDPLQYSKYVTEGPSTSGMPSEAPGNIGSWVGWRIVNAYIKKNPTVTLPQLMQEEDAQKILTDSKYKPTR